jgi:hypothetical protein
MLDKQGYTRARIYIYIHTHTQKYVILIASPPQQWFREHASLLRYTYIACLLSCLRSVLLNTNNSAVTSRFRSKPEHGGRSFPEM